MGSVSFGSGGGQGGVIGGEAHGVVALVDVDGGARDAGGQRAAEEGRRAADLGGGDGLGQGGGALAVLDHALDDADGGGGPRGPRTGGDHVYPVPPTTAGLVGQHPG